MLLANPASYVSLAQLRAMPLDFDLTGYSDTQLTDILARASGAADGIMQRTYLATEVTEQFEGNGTNVLVGLMTPVAYVKSVQLVMPGYAPFTLPLGALLIDSKRGSIKSWTPMYFQSLGVSGAFPDGELPIVVNYAYGWNLPIPAPAFTAAAASGGSLAAVQYDVAVTTRTQTGESMPSPVQTVTVGANGAIALAITPQPGAYVYRVYLAAHGVTPLTLVAESPATAYGTNTINVTVTSATPPPGLFVTNAPTTDTSAWPIPGEVTEAVRLLAMMQIFENNNLANRGIASTQSNRKRTMWKSTEGSSGKGIPLYAEQADNLLDAFKYRAIF